MVFILGLWKLLRLRFWMAWHWKPAIKEVQSNNNDNNNNKKSSFESSLCGNFFVSKYFYQRFLYGTKFTLYWTTYSVLLGASSLCSYFVGLLSLLAGTMLELSKFTVFSLVFRDFFSDLFVHKGLCTPLRHWSSDKKNVTSSVCLRPDCWMDQLTTIWSRLKRESF